jgi:alcohol dehydrogenase class IV
MEGYSMENTHNFLIPKTNLIGVGAIKDLPNELLSWKLKKALIVTDKNIIKLGYVENIEKILKSLFISYDIFDGILHPDSTVSFVEDAMSYFPKGVKNAYKRKYSFIISIGGGTNHDCGKAVATVAANGGSITDYEGYNIVKKPILPYIAINTTGGSGAELSNFAIITDESRKVKMVIGSPKMVHICL